MTSTFMERITLVFPVQTGDTLIAGVTVTTAEDKVTFAPARPINVVRWGFIIDTLLDVGTALTAHEMDLRPDAGSDTLRVNGATDSDGVDTAGGSLTLAAVDIAVGLGVYHNVSPKFQVDPGEELVIQCSVAPDTGGTAFYFIEYEQEPFHDGPGGGAALSFSNRLSNMTEVTS